MKYFIYSLLLLFTIDSQAQHDNLVKHAEAYSQAIVDRDFEKVISLTLPNIVEMGGGGELMTKDLHNERQVMVDNGLDFISASVGSQEKYFESNEDLQVLLPITYKMVSKKAELEIYSKLLAVSKDKGETWFFLDIEKYDKESLKSFYPNLNEAMEF